MKKLARLFLLCVMMIAIPVQGIAASAMPCCSTEHHQSVESDQSLGNHSAEQSYAAHGDHSSTTGSCSSCTDCCTGCAPAMMSSDICTSKPSSEKINAVFSSHVGHVSDGPERPPRA